MASFDVSMPYFGSSDRQMEQPMPALNPNFIPIASSIMRPPIPPPTLATPVPSPPPKALIPSTQPPHPPSVSLSPPTSTPSASTPFLATPAPNALFSLVLLPKAKKPWTEVERSALKDAVVKYRNRKNQHKLPWKEILNDPLYCQYRVDRSKDAIMQQWKTLKKEVALLPLPEGSESDVSVSDSTDSDASESSSRASTPLPSGLPPPPHPHVKRPSAAKIKWTEKDTAILDEAIHQHGTDWRRILSDPVFAKRLKNRNPVSLGKNYHRFHPRGIEAKKQALEEKRRRKAAKDEKAALEELSSTSEDESDDEAPKQGGAGGPPGSGSGVTASKRHRDDDESAAGSGSDSDDSGVMSSGSTDDESSGPSSPSLSSLTVDAPIQSWEKPDSRDVAHFRRCRHVCGCKSLTSDGREFVNSQAVMVRGSRRNHEVNQNLHPQCRALHRECERLLGPLKERKDKKRRKTRTAPEQKDDYDELMEEEEEQREGEGKKKRGGRRGNGALNGGHKGEAAFGHSPVKREDSHQPPSVSTSAFGSLELQPQLKSEPLSPSSSHAWLALQDQAQTAAVSLESVQQLIRTLQSRVASSSSFPPPPQPPSAPSPTTANSLADRYEQLLERTTQQEEELQRLRDTVRVLEEKLQRAAEAAGPSVKTEPAAGSGA